MSAAMCEKSSAFTTKTVDPSNLPDVQSPILRAKYGLRTSRQVLPRPTARPLESNLKTPMFSKLSNHGNVSGSYGNLKSKDLTSPRHDVKSTLTNNTGKPRQILSANFPSTVDTLPLRNKMTLMKSNLSRSSLQYKSPDIFLRNKESPSAWTRHLNSKHTTARPLPTTPRVHVDCFDSMELEHKSLKGFDEIVTKTYDVKGDYRTKNTNMGYREKCLQWLLTLPD